MQTRKQRVQQAYQHGNLLTVDDPRYRRTLQAYIDSFLQQDLEDTGDITYRALFNGQKRTSIVEMQQEGIVAGIEEAKYIMDSLGLNYKNGTADGEHVQPTQHILEKQGKLEDILTSERIGLNLLQRMSGIATRTKQLVDIAKRYGVALAATRKTDLGLLDKKAVYIGGGLTHRLGLYDAVMIKDTHIDQLANINQYSTEQAIEYAINQCYQANPKARFIEVEVRTKQQAIIAAQTYSQLEKRPDQEFIIMLDNFKPQEIRETLQELQSRQLYNIALLEASGGITKSTLEQYARTGIDVISIGSLTSEVKKLKIHEVCLN